MVRNEYIRDYQMTTKQITATNADEQIRQLYQTAFPEEEQIPCPDLMRLVGELQLVLVLRSQGRTAREGHRSTDTNATHGAV